VTLGGESNFARVAFISYTCISAMFWYENEMRVEEGEEKKRTKERTEKERGREGVNEVE
jgi:hypothetical protein